jgi:crossover junction endodeoxyribonuclease RuvC
MNTLPPGVTGRQMVLGIDISVQGALAFVDDQGLLHQGYAAPVLESKPAGHWAIDAPLLAHLIAAFTKEALTFALPPHAFVEGANARPHEGPTGAFAFSRSRGVIEGVLASHHIPTTFLSPPSWKKAVGFTLKSKDFSRAEAIRRWPASSDLFKLKKWDGRADAALIALAGPLRAGKLK